MTGNRRPARAGGNGSRRPGAAGLIAAGALLLGLQALPGPLQAAGAGADAAAGTDLAAADGGTGSPATPLSGQTGRTTSPAASAPAAVANPGPAGPGGTANGASRPLDVQTLWQIRRVGAPDLSPDGSQAVVPVTSFVMEQDRSYTALWLVATDGTTPARQLTSGDFNDVSATFSPDGRFVAFVSRRGTDEQNQLYVIPTTGGEARRITAVPTGVSAPKWFPDGRSVAFLSPVWPDLATWAAQGERLRQRAASPMTARVWDRAPIAYWDRYLDDRHVHLFAVDLTTSEVRDITRGSGASVEFRTPGAEDYDISPDGLEVAFVAETDARGTRPDEDIFVVAAAGGGTAVNLTAGNEAADGHPDYSPDGRSLAWTANRIRSAPDRDRLHLLARVPGQPTTPGTPRVLAPDWDWSVAEYSWTPDSRAILLAAEDRPTRRLFRLPVAGTATPERLTSEGDFAGAVMAGDGTIVALRSSFTQPPTLIKVEPRRMARQLSRFNDALLATVRMGAVESVSYPGANGVPIQMWVVRPPDFDPGRRWPLFLLLHGGPHVGITDLWTFRWNAQVFAGWGYVTAWHNFHGSSGFGDAFADSINPDRTTLPYQDTIAAARWFEAQPWIDPARMVAGGGSYGGYLASVLLGREHPFQALVAHAPVYNNYTQVAADYAASENRFAEFWEDPATWQATSPHMQAGSFRTPTLVIHGQQDLRVPVNHGVELFHALQIRGVPSRFIYYPNENHWILRPQNSVFWYEEVQKWIASYAPPGGRP